MKITYCLPIIKSKKEEIFEIIVKNIADYQYFEIWLDYIEELDEAFITKLTNLLQDKLIILFRRQNLETIVMDLQKRLDSISLISRGESFVDLDISQKEEFEYIQKNEIKIKTIVSYHNYEKTPNDETLHNIIKEMDKYNPTTYKITTMCQNENDALRLLQLQSQLKNENKKHIVLGMGKFGTITRVFATLWGNEMIFAPKNLEEKSANGQLTKHDLEKIFDILNT